MSRWTHSICDACWQQRNPERLPHRLIEPEVEQCCWCGITTLSGIYVREDPQLLACKGEHVIAVNQ